MIWIPDNVCRSLADLVKSLQSHKVKYLIVGAIPVQYYGRPRTSGDVDVVFITTVTKKKLSVIFPSNRYEIVGGDKTVFKLKDSKTNSFIDVMLRPSQLGLTQESFKRKRTVLIKDASVNIPSAEDYMLTKLKARRAGTSDYQDIITTMENMYNELDWQYLEKRGKKLGVYHLIKHYKEGLQWKLKR